jgi:hypothetical protein
VWHHLTYIYLSERPHEWAAIMRWILDATKLAYRRASNAYMRTNGGYTPEERGDPSFKSLLDCGPLEYYLELHAARILDAAEHDRAVEPLSPQCGHLPITVEVMKYVQRSAHPDHHFPPQPHWLPQPTVAEQAKMIEIVSGELLEGRPPSQLYASIDLSLALRHYQNHRAHRRACVAKWQTPELGAVFNRWAGAKVAGMRESGVSSREIQLWTFKSLLSPTLLFRSRLLWALDQSAASLINLDFDDVPALRMQSGSDGLMNARPYHNCPGGQRAPADAPSHEAAEDLPNYCAELAAASDLDSSFDFKAHLESTGCSCGFGDLTCTTDACVKPPTVARSGSDGDSAAAAATPPVMQSPTATAVYLNALRRRMIRDKHLKLSRLKQPQSADGHSEAELQRHAAATASMKNEDLWPIDLDIHGNWSRSVESMVEQLPLFTHPLAAYSELRQRSPAYALLLASAKRGSLLNEHALHQESTKRSRVIEPRSSGAASRSPEAKKMRSTIPVHVRSALVFLSKNYRSCDLWLLFDYSAMMNQLQLQWRALVQEEMRSFEHFRIESKHERSRMAMRFWMDKCLIPYFERKEVLPMYEWRTRGGRVFGPDTIEEHAQSAKWDTIYVDSSTEVCGLLGAYARVRLSKNALIKPVAGYVLPGELLRLCPIGHFTAIALQGAIKPHVIIADPTDAVAQINHDQPYDRTSAKFCTDVSKMSQPRMSSCRRFVAESGVVQSDFYRARTLKAVPRGKELTIYYGTDAEYWNHLSLTCEHCALKDSPNESSTLVDPVQRCSDAACHTGWHADCYQQRHHRAMPRRWTCRMHAKKKAAARFAPTSSVSGVGYFGAAPTTPAPHQWTYAPVVPTHPNLLHTDAPNSVEELRVRNAVFGEPDANVEVVAAVDISQLHSPCALRVVTKRNLLKGSNVTFFGGNPTRKDDPIMLSEPGGKLYAKRVYNNPHLLWNGKPIADMFNRPVCETAAELALLSAAPASTFLPRASDYSPAAMAHFAAMPKGFMANDPTGRFLGGQPMKPNAKFVFHGGSFKTGELAQAEADVLQLTVDCPQGTEIVWTYGSTDSRAGFPPIGEAAPAVLAGAAVPPAAACAVLPAHSAPPDFTCDGVPLVYGKNLTDMRDSTAAYLAGDFAALRANLATDGYLYVRGVIPSGIIAEARSCVLQQMRSFGRIPSIAPADSAVPAQSRASRDRTVDLRSGEAVGVSASAAETEGWKIVGSSASVAAVTRGPEIDALIRGLCGADAAASSATGAVDGPYSRVDSHFVRTKAPGKGTALHSDWIYYYKNTDAVVKYCQRPQPSGSASSSAAVRSCAECQRASPLAELLCSLCGLSFHSACQQPSNRVGLTAGWACCSCVNAQVHLNTVWTPLQSLEGRHTSRLVVIPGSHLLGGYEAPIRGDLLPAEADAEFRDSATYAIVPHSDMGCIVVFNGKLIHGSNLNLSIEFRISMDWRFFGRLADHRLQLLSAAAPASSARCGPIVLLDPSLYSFAAALPRHPNILLPVPAGLFAAHDEVKLPLQRIAVRAFGLGSRVGERCRLGVVSTEAINPGKWITHYGDHVCASADIQMQLHGTRGTMLAGSEGLVYDAAPIANMYRTVVCHTPLALSQVEYLDPALLLPLASEYSAADLARFNSAPKGGMVCSVAGRVDANGRPLEPNVKWVHMDTKIIIGARTGRYGYVLVATRKIMADEELLLGKQAAGAPASLIGSAGAAPQSSILPTSAQSSFPADSLAAPVSYCSSALVDSPTAVFDFADLLSEVETMMTSYLHITEAPDFRLGKMRMRSGDIVNQSFLLSAMPLSTDTPAPLLALISRMREFMRTNLFAETPVGPDLRPPYSSSVEWRERIYAFESRPPAAAATACASSSPPDFGFIPMLHELQAAFTLRLYNREAVWGVGPVLNTPSLQNCHAVALAVEMLTSAVVRDWLVARARGPARERQFYKALSRFANFFFALVPPPQNADFWTRTAHAAIIVALMYLATHVIFVQTDYSSAAPRSGVLVASHSVCTFIERNLEVPRRLHNAELLAECVAVFFEEASFRHLCIPLWRSGVAEPGRLPQLPASVSGNIGVYLSKQLHHFIITLMHIHLCMRRAFGGRPPRTRPAVSAAAAVPSPALAPSVDADVNDSEEQPPTYQQATAHSSPADEHAI